MLNKVMLIGNLGRDPEMRALPSGQQLATFSLATNRRWNDRDGNRQEETEWHTIEAWGRQAEIAGQYLRKGSTIYVEGRIKTDSWEDKQSGDKRYRTKIVCDRFQMLGVRGDDARSAGGGGSHRPAAGGGAAHDGGQYGGVDDDIPF